MRNRRFLLPLSACLALFALSPVGAQASSGPAWSSPGLFSEPTNLNPAGSDYASLDGYFFTFDNIGGAPTAGPITITDTLPPGLSAISATVSSGSAKADSSKGSCTIGSPTAEDVTCTVTASVGIGESVAGHIGVDPGGLVTGTVVDNHLTINGGGAASASAATSTQISSDDSTFDFLPGLNGLSSNLADGDGQASSQAGSHPAQFAFRFTVPLDNAEAPGPDASTTTTVSDGGVRDLRTYLPAGLIVSPLATPRCNEVELESETCPASAAIGQANLNSSIVGGYGSDITSLYNVIPPPGAASNFSWNAVGVGIFPHILGGLKPGSYSLAASTQAVLALPTHPAQGIRVKLWGDPSSPGFDRWRGICNAGNKGPSDTCPAPPSSTPLLTLPTSCQASPHIESEMDSWGHPGDFLQRSAPLTDAAGNPTPVIGCEALTYDSAGPSAPTLSARPTTNVADSPSGLSADLHIPQSDDLDTLATPHLKKAVVTLPAGLVLNPSSANGLGSCSSAQIGIDPNTGVANGDPVTCPAASRIGTVKVDTPLLDHPAPGSVYIAAPYDNPFDSLLAIYVTVDDPISGTLIKLAGHVQADPNTGQLTTTFDDNPQLPFSDFKLEFKSGPHGVLRTPPTCGPYSTISELIPWSGTTPASPHDDYSIEQGPGGTCAGSPDQQPNSPSFDAGTVSPVAGTYSPLVMHLSRNDGDQQFASLTLTTPPGLLGKLAGTTSCSDADLAAASSRSGAAEKASPSCPDSAKLGTVTVGAGAGPSPYYTEGAAYLAGPYKGAPLSIAIITPAVAGPYDLGTVVVRSAVNLDPATAQITATSDPIPQILQGIPLDVRSVVLHLNRPDFTLNGTSCDPSTIDGSLLSSLGQLAPLSERFQLAECANLPFKPKLTLTLKGKTKRTAHPSLIANLSAKPGEANIARTQVKLPGAAFIDQDHIGTVCTRVQFAAKSCPSRSVYGTVTATTPLLDYPLTGNVYLRSSNHPLPDLIADLRGPDTQPVEIALAGKTDSVKGALRNTFEAVPDAPVSKFHLELFGGKRGLIELSSGLCKSPRAVIQMDGQNGKVWDTNPVVRTSCPKKHRKHKKR